MYGVPFAPIGPYGMGPNERKSRKTPLQVRAADASGVPASLTYPNTAEAATNGRQPDVGQLPRRRNRFSGAESNGTLHRPHHSYSSRADPPRAGSTVLILGLGAARAYRARAEHPVRARSRDRARGDGNCLLREGSAAQAQRRDQAAAAGARVSWRDPHAVPARSGN